jgi:hypothetical protein
LAAYESKVPLGNTGYGVRFCFQERRTGHYFAATLYVQNVFILSLLALGFGGAAPPQEERVRIGKVPYGVKRSAVFLKDMGYQCTWLSLHSSGGEHQAGLQLECRRGDTLFVRGACRITANGLITTTSDPFRQGQEPDSAVTTFIQNKEGKLALRSSLEYVDGKAREVK